MVKKTLNVQSLPYGKTHNMLINIKDTTFYMDVDKNKINAILQVYDYSPEVDRTHMSKYNSDLMTISVKSDAYLNTEFFENFEQIAKAQEICRKWEGVLQ